MDIEQPFYKQGDITIYNADFGKISEFSCSAVITDPPYLKRYLPLYGELAALLPKVLVRGGSLLSIVPHYGLPTVLESVGKHLKYRWINCMWQADGSHPRMAMGIEVMWKPVVWWVNEAWPQGRGFVRDGFVNTPKKKEYHKWEQSLDWAEYCLKFVPKGELVIDPYCGSGTLLVACKKLGYPAIGIDIDRVACQTTADRLEAIE